MNESINQYIIGVCLCVGGVELFRGIAYVFTVRYICTPGAYDSRHILSTVRKLTLRAAAILSRGLSIGTIILPAFFSILKNVLTLQIAPLTPLLPSA